MKRLAILYGTNEGPALTWRLRPVLAAHGYELTTDIASADCTMAHSGGVLLLPPKLPGKTVLITVPSTGYRGTLLSAMIVKIALDIKYSWRQKQMGFWFRKTAINLMYALNIPRTYRLYKLNKRYEYNLPSCEAGKVAVLVQPTDPWSQDLPGDTVNDHPTYVFATTPGHHDDLWSHPEPYIRLLTKFTEQ